MEASRKNFNFRALDMVSTAMDIVHYFNGTAQDEKIFGMSLSKMI